MVPTQISCRLFSPTGFFPAGFFWPPSDSSSCINCHSALSLVLCLILLDLVIGCSITYRYCYWCSVLTAKINLMVFPHVVYCVVELKSVTDEKIAKQLTFSPADFLVLRDSYER